MSGTLRIDSVPLLLAQWEMRLQEGQNHLLKEAHAKLRRHDLGWIGLHTPNLESASSVDLKPHQKPDYVNFLCTQLAILRQHINPRDVCRRDWVMG